MSKDKLAVGFVGLGIMGQPMAVNILKANAAANSRLLALLQV